MDMRIQGVIKYSELEGGSYELHADDGGIYTLAADGDVPDFAAMADKHVEIKGDVPKDAASVFMRGPVLRVTSVHHTI